MKYFALILIISAGFLTHSCLNKNEISEPRETQEHGFDKENITLFPDQSVQVDRYENAIDTVYINRFLNLNIGSKVNEGDSVSFDWKIGEALFTNPVFEKTRHGTSWLASSAVETDLYNQPSLLPVSVKIKFLKSGITKERKAAIHITKSIQKRDLFSLNFGMSKAEVKQNYIGLIPASHHAHFAEITPNTIVSQGGYLKQDYGFRLLFSEDKLTAIAEIAGTTPESFLTFNEVFKKLKAPQTFRQEYNPETKQLELYPKLPFTWTYSNIKFRTELKELEESSTVRKKYYALIYEKGL